MLNGRHRKCGKPCCGGAVRASSTRRGACCSRAPWAASGPGPCGPACCVSGAAGCSPPSAWPSGCSRSCASCPASACSTGRRPSSSRRRRANRPPSRRVCRVCGIVGYVGARQAAPILVDGLRRLEYRGYDSAGVAVRSEEHTSELQSLAYLVCRLLLEKKKKDNNRITLNTVPS